MSHRKSRKNFAGASNYNFCYFLYFCGTIKIGTIKHYPHEIIIVPQKEQKWQKGLRRLIRKIPLFNFLKFLTLKF